MHYLRKSLLARLVVSFLLLSLLTVSLVAAVAFIRARSALQTSAFDRLQVAATLKQDALTQWVTDQQRDLLLMAELPSVRGPVQDLLRSATDSSAARRAYATLQATLASITRHKTAWQELFILSDEGRVVISTDSTHEGEFRARERYFTQGRTQMYIQKVYLLPETLLPAITIAAPLKDAADQPGGVLVIHLNLERMDHIILERTGLGTGSESYLVDRYNVFLSSVRFGRKEFPRSVHSDGIDQALQHHNGAGLYRNYRGIAVIGVYYWLDDLEAALLVELPQAIAFAPARRLAWAILVTGLSIAVVLTMGTYLLARQIARPILHITDTALQVADGDLTAAAPVLTEDEIGTLARTFNVMTQRLRVLYQDLDDEIRERKQIQEDREHLIADLEAKNAELERFTYTVSHDLKSPLVTIRGFLGLLEQDTFKGDVERMHKDMQQIQDATEKMQQLLSELLELSRIGRLVNPPEIVSLSDVAQEAATLVAGQIEDRGVEIDIDADMPSVVGDRTRLLEVYQNLIDNAVKFMGRQAHPRIEIGTRNDLNEAIFYVRDNGIGINPRYHEKVFGLFERLDLENDGTGIGLALVKRIVEIHGGRIWIESEGSGHGSMFCFTLPAADVSNEALLPNRV